MQKRKIHLIGNAHLDPIWLWQWQEGLAEIKATFRSALDRMKEFENFIFTSACGSYYMWIEKSDPSMFEEIRQRVREGRWCLVGGWFLQPDCNIPCGESFARHALITQRYFMEKFGKIATVGYNVDSFGHNGNLPMILKQSRMNSYVFMRPQCFEKTLPQNLFLWQSRNGDCVMTYRLPFFYCIDESRLHCFEDIHNLEDPHDQMAFYGIGNHGGGPTASLLNYMKENLSEDFIYSDPNRFFSQQDESSLPVIFDDMQFHAKGCYSVYSEGKALNRKAEQALLRTERFSVLSTHLMKTQYPHEELDRGWKDLLFHQFHDVLGGCSIQEAHDDARKFYNEALAIADRNSNFALQQISWNVNTLERCDESNLVTSEQAAQLGFPIVVFNALPFAVRMPVHLRNVYTKITDVQGTSVPLQVVRDSKTNGSSKFGRLFEAEIPALGYAVYHCFKNTETESSSSPFTITDTSLANEKIRISFDPTTGEIVEYFIMAQQKNLLSAPTKISLFNDESSDTWAHKLVTYTEETPLSVKGTIHVIESGPVRATMRVEQHFGNSHIIRDFSITPDSEVVTVRCKIDFHEHFGVLKFEHPVNIEDPVAICQIPYGWIERQNDKSEQVCGDWICMRNTLEGLAIATDSKHSFSADGSALSLTVLRNALFADHFGQPYRDEFCEFTEEQAIHHFSYSIFPFFSPVDADRKALMLQNPLMAIPETFHRGKLPLFFEGVSISKDNLILTALKGSEDQSATIIRLLECNGIDTEATVSLFGFSFPVSIAKNSIVTYRIQNGKVTKTDFIE